MNQNPIFESSQTIIGVCGGAQISDEIYQLVEKLGLLIAEQGFILVCGGLCGTMEAACRLVENLGAEIVQISFLIELNFLKGKEKLNGYDVRSLIEYNSE